MAIFEDRQLTEEEASLIHETIRMLIKLELTCPSKDVLRQVMFSYYLQTTLDSIYNTQRPQITEALFDKHEVMNELSLLIRNKLQEAQENAKSRN